MIGRLRGQLVATRPPELLLEVGGVGYELEAPMSTFYELAAVGETVTLLTHLVVREDAHILYGFRHEPERALFRQLLKISGIGPRMALGILSGMDAEQFARCVERADHESLMRLPGIGRKTAERLVLELRGRVAAPPRGGAVASRAGPRTLAAAPAAPETREQAYEDAVSALIALGYRPADAARLVRAVDDGARGREDLIRAALRSLHPG